MGERVSVAIMTAYRFRLKAERESEPFWRDIVVGSDCTLRDLQAIIAEATGLDDDSLWFFGTDRDYWESPVKYQQPVEFEELPSGGSMRWDEDAFNAAETTVRQLGLARLDRICYLYDYVDEWRFYAIVDQVLEDEPDDRPPKVVGSRGDPTAVQPFRIRS